jgi:pimeloyl-ACP methyl ester carboxylesterase
MRHHGREALDPLHASAFMNDALPPCTPHGHSSGLRRQRRKALSWIAGLGAAPLLSLAAGCGGRGNDDDEEGVVRLEHSVAVDAEVTLHVRQWQRRDTAMPAVVLLAGLDGTASYFDSLGPVLARACNVYAVTRRGFGASGKPLPSDGARYDPATLVHDLSIVFDALGIPSATLCGHSMAGNELTAFSAAHPHRVDALAYLDTTFDYTDIQVPDHPPVPDNPALTEPEPTAADHASWSAAVRFHRRLCKGWYPPLEHNLRDLLEVRPDGSVRPTTPAPARAAYMAAAYAYSPPYRAVSRPCLVVTAVPAAIRDLMPWLSAPLDARTAEDAQALLRLGRALRQLDARRLREALPQCHQLTIDGASHGDFLMAYEAVVAPAIQRLVSVAGSGRRS